MTKKSFKKADPNYQKELAKYGNPIPSRDYIQIGRASCRERV